MAVIKQGQVKPINEVEVGVPDWIILKGNIDEDWEGFLIESRLSTVIGRGRVADGSRSYLVEMVRWIDDTGLPLIFSLDASSKSENLTITENQPFEKIPEWGKGVFVAHTQDIISWCAEKNLKVAEPVWTYLWRCGAITKPTIKIETEKDLIGTHIVKQIIPSWADFFPKKLQGLSADYEQCATYLRDARFDIKKGHMITQLDGFWIGDTHIGKCSFSCSTPFAQGADSGESGYDEDDAAQKISVSYIVISPEVKFRFSIIEEETNWRDGIGSEEDNKKMSIVDEKVLSIMSPHIISYCKQAKLTSPPCLIKTH